MFFVFEWDAADPILNAQNLGSDYRKRLIPYVLGRGDGEGSARNQGPNVSIWTVLNVARSILKDPNNRQLVALQTRWSLKSRQAPLGSKMSNNWTCATYRRFPRTPHEFHLPILRRHNNPAAQALAIPRDMKSRKDIHPETESERKTVKVEYMVTQVQKKRQIKNEAIIVKSRAKD